MLLMQNYGIFCTALKRDRKESKVPYVHGFQVYTAKTAQNYLKNHPKTLDTRRSSNFQGIFCFCFVFHFVNHVCNIYNRSAFFFCSTYVLFIYSLVFQQNNVMLGQYHQETWGYKCYPNGLNVFDSFWVLLSGKTWFLWYLGRHLAGTRTIQSKSYLGDIGPLMVWTDRAQ